jgi:hypothetical protein
MSETNSTRVYELINMSDTITFEATEPEAAVIADIMLMSMMFVKDVDTGEKPICADPIAERDAIWQSEERLASYIRAWESFMIAAPRDRKLFKMITERMSPEETLAFASKWHKERRTSLNDICAKIWANAAKMRAQGVDKMAIAS